MQKEHGKMFLWGTLLLLCSCIDGTYDLSKKEIMTDMKIEGNKLALPIGSLLPMQLDSMLDMDDLEILKEIDGVYSIAHSGKVDPISINIDEIGLSIPSISYKEEFSFKENDIMIEEIVLDGFNEIVDIDIAEISIESLNEELPTVDEHHSISIISDELKGLLNQYGEQIPSFSHDFKTDVYYEGDAPLDFSYEMPKEVKNIKEIELTHIDAPEENQGAFVEFTFTVPDRIIDINHELFFQVNFPKELIVSPSDNKTGKYKLEGHVLTVEDLTVSNGKASVEFYIKGFTDMDNEKFYEEKNGKRYITYNEGLKYTVKYKAAGNINITPSVTIDEFVLAINAHSDFALYDVEGETNPIEFNFDNECFDFTTEIDGLDGIAEVKSITLNPEISKINLYINMPQLYHPFKLRKGDSFVIDIPKTIYINERLSVFPEGITFDRSTNLIHIYEDYALKEAQLTLALDSIVVNQPIIDDKITIQAEAHIKTDGDVVFEGTTVSLRKDLASLKEKEVEFGMDEARIAIEEIIVVAEPINETFHEVMKIDIDEPIEKGIDKIYTVGFKEEVDMNLDFTLTGLEDITTPLNIDITAQLPAFICIESQDADVTIKDNVLNIKTQYKPGNTFKKHVRITKLDFTQMPDGYLAPKMDNKGKYHLQYTDSIVIDAKTSLDETKLSSDLLDKTIGVNMNLNIDDIVLKKFEGIVNLDIDKIEESIELNLDEELDFLNNEENALVLSEPQIMIALENSINVPVLVDLAILGKDAQGNVIETSRIELRDLRINPAHYDETTGIITPDSTKYLFAPSKEITKQGYETVELPNLATLLQKLPNSISFELLPRIDVSTTHHINLSQPLSFSGAYDIVVPFKFDDLHVTYTDTIVGLDMQMAEISEYFSNMELHLRMNVKNTMPLGLTLTTIPLDANGKKLTNLEINEVKIAAGNGEAIKGSSEATAVELGIKTKGKADFSALDQLAFTLEAYANETVGGAALKPVQGIQITDIVIEARGDIEFDLKDMNQ